MYVIMAKSKVNRCHNAYKTDKLTRGHKYSSNSRNNKHPY